MDRRDFLKKSAVIAVAAAAAPQVAGAAVVGGEGAAEGADPGRNGKLIVSAPMLQNYAATSMGIAFAVSDMANGFVEYSENEDFTDSVKVKCGGFRVTAMDKDVIQVRLTGLKPATKYYYRISADRIDYVHGHKMFIIGSEQDPRTYSFTTAGTGASAHFCVINDTHAIWPPFAACIEKVHELNPSCVIWNGDACSASETIDKQKEVFLCPPIDRKDYAAFTPYLLCHGNHECRGLANRHLERVWMFRQPEERLSRDWDLGRNFAVRMGDVALIGLDTGEDKVDENPLYCNLFNSGPYREAQALWLKDALKRKEIASAPYLVAICHIPLFSSDPTHNPGDVHPADKDPRYSSDYAFWQRTCSELWGPLLQKAGCQLVITAHMHRYRYDAPTADRKWAHLVGGGPKLEEGNGFPTVIEGKVENGKLVINVHNVFTGKIQDTFTFKKRR